MRARKLFRTENCERRREIPLYIAAMRGADISPSARSSERRSKDEIAQERGSKDMDPPVAESALLASRVPSAPLRERVMREPALPSARESVVHEIGRSAVVRDNVVRDNSAAGNAHAGNVF